MPLFDELITKHGGTYKPFKQIEYIENNSPKWYHAITSKIVDPGPLLDAEDKPGVCLALSTIFLARYNKAAIASTDDPFGGKTTMQITKDATYVPRVSGIQATERTRGAEYKKTNTAYGPTSGQGQVAIDQAYDTLYKTYGIGKLLHDNVTALGQKGRTLDSPPEGYQIYPPFTQLIDCLSTYDGRYLIKYPAHYVATITDLKRPKFKYFDPNFGQGIFTSKSNFKLFLNEFYNHNAVISSYKLKHINLTYLSL